MRIEKEKFTIYEVEELCKKLLLEIKKHKDIEIDMQEVKKIDMPAIQLLISTMKSCHAKEGNLRLSNISDEVRQSLRVSGCNVVLGVIDE